VSGGSTAAALPETKKPIGRVIAQRLLQLEHGASSEDLLERILSPGKPATGMAPGEGQSRSKILAWFSGLFTLIFGGLISGAKVPEIHEEKGARLIWKVKSGLRQSTLRSCWSRSGA
jgi:hypothetical protein